MAWRIVPETKAIRPERCPACGEEAAVTTVARPCGLPSWICLSCGHRIYEEGKASLRSLCRRLAARNAAARNGEIAGLVKMGLDALPAIRALQRSWWYRSRCDLSCVDALVKIGGHDAAEEVARILMRQRRWARWGPALYFVWYVFVMSAFCIGFDYVVWRHGHHSGTMPCSFLPAGIMSTVQAARNYRQNRVRALELASLLNDPALCGVLAVSYTERRLREQALAPLRRLLPQVTEEHAAQWDARQKAAVIRLLGDEDDEIIRGALQAVSLLGAADAIDPIERLARHGPPELHDSIEAALDAVRRRIDRQKDRETLLRASTQQDSSPDTLLRPAAAIPDPALEQLLRQAPEHPRE
jgi:hypothetical protein